MALTVVFSTLMVLVAQQDQDFNTLWSTPGAVNDPSGDKHTLPLQEVILGGNFKSAIVDDWTVQDFDCVSVYGINMYGDVLWETEFNITNKTPPLSSWLLSEQIISSMAEISGSQNVISNTDNYELRFSPSSGTSWFAVSTRSLSYGPLPLIFVPRSPNTPFDEPVFLNGPLGCWMTSVLINYQFNFEDDTSMTPTLCIEQCVLVGKTVAVLVFGKKCYCGDVDPANPPIDYQSYCFMTCSGSSDKCGQISENYGNAFHVQGSALPGDTPLTSIYSTVLSNVNSKIQISSYDVYGMSSLYMFISRVTLDTGTTNSTYTIHYSELDCSASAGNMKVVTSDGVTQQHFFGSGLVAMVDILRVLCIEFVLNVPVPSATVQLFGPDDSFDHVAAPFLVVRGKKYVTDQTTSTTLAPTTTPTTAAPTTTSTAASPTTTSTTTSTTASPTTTSTTASPTTTSTTASPTTTSTTASPTTTSTTTSTTASPTTTSTTASPTTTSTTASPTTTSTTASQTTTSTSTSTQATTPSTMSTSSSTPASTSTTSNHQSTSATSSSSAATETSSSTSASSQTTTAPKCSCPCNSSLPQLNLTTEQLQARIVEIQNRLAVNVSKLSSTIRKLTSAEDSRVSAVSIGYVGVGILVCILASIVFIDSARLLRDLKKLFFNIRDGLCPKKENNIQTN